MRRTLISAGLLAGLLAPCSPVSGQDTAGNAARDVTAPIAVTSNSAEQHIEAGLASYWRLRFPEAERHFRAAADADPQSAAAHYYLGYAIYKTAEPKRPNDPGKQRAALEFAKAYEIDPGFRPGWGGPGL